MIVAAISIDGVYLVLNAQKENIPLADMTEKLPFIQGSNWNTLGEVWTAWGLVFYH